jgi:hypothetical protein
MNSIVSEKQFISSRLGIPYENLSQSYLRAQTALSTQSLIPFQVQANAVSAPLVTENLLQLNDQFVISHFTVGLCQVASDTPSNTQLLAAEFFTYADPVRFTGTNAVNAGAIYGGFLNFTINRREFLPSFPMRAFYRVPTTQTNAFLRTAGTVATPAATFTGATGVNGYENGLFGFFPSEPTLIDGRMTLNININLESAVAFDDSSNTIYAVLELRGYLVVNSKN